MKSALHGDALWFVCPGCEAMNDLGSGMLRLTVNSSTKSPSWAWDGNLEAPTLSPSIKSYGGPFSDTGKPLGVCHSMLQAGVFHFLEDSTHALAGQHVPLSDLPKWFTDPDSVDDMADENLSELNKDELLEKARELDVSGRSGMTKDELVAAIEAAEAEGAAAAGTETHDDKLAAPGEPAPVDSHGHTSASLAAAIANSNVSQRLVTEEQIQAQSPPPVG